MAAPAPLRVSGHDWQDVGRALDQVFQPAKVNDLVMGTICPHVHCYLPPHFFTDDPTKPVNMSEEQGILPPDQYAAWPDARSSAPRPGRRTCLRM